MTNILLGINIGLTSNFKLQNLEKNIGEKYFLWYNTNSIIIDRILVRG